MVSQRPKALWIRCLARIQSGSWTGFRWAFSVPLYLSHHSSQSFGRGTCGLRRLCCLLRLTEYQEDTGGNPMLALRRLRPSREIHPSLYCSFHWALRRELDISSTISWNANEVELEKTNSSEYGRPLLATHEVGTYFKRKSCSTVVFQSPTNILD